MTHLYRTVLIAAALSAGGYVAHAGEPQPSRGKQVFDRWCSACHAPSIRAPGTTALAAKYGKDQPAALEQRRDLTPEIVSYFVRHGVSVMPSFRKTEISDEELTSLANYLAHTSPTRRK